MPDRQRQSIETSYTDAARVYASQLFSELDGKPLDRLLLQHFVELTRGRGTVCDLACGPGQIAAFMRDCGAAVCGLDLSQGMIEEAHERSPEIPFYVGNMLALPIDTQWAGIACFYGIVHFKPTDLVAVFKSMFGALAPGGKLLLACHVGGISKHVDDMWGVSVSLDFVYFNTADLAAAAIEAGLTVSMILERGPYEGAEYPSRRAYLLAERLD